MYPSRMAISVLVALLVAMIARSEPEPAKPRKIAKAPAFKEAKQQYLLLLLGQKPSREIWVVRDGSDVYVDRNGNGDLTEPGECIFQPDTNESASFVKLGMVHDAHGQEHGPLTCQIPTRSPGDGRVRLHIAKKFEQEAPYVPFGNSPETASVLHFDGPLSARLSGPPYPANPFPLTLSRKMARPVIARIGTGTHDRTSVFCVTFAVSGRNKDLWPKLKIEYENRDPKSPPIVENYQLHEETRTYFSVLGRVKAPANSGSKAKLTLTIPAPKDVPTIELDVPVVD